MLLGGHPAMNYYTLISFRLATILARAQTVEQASGRQRRRPRRRRTRWRRECRHGRLKAGATSDVLLSPSSLRAAKIPRGGQFPAPLKN